MNTKYTKTIITRISDNDLYTINKILHTTTFGNLSGYFTYLFENLLSDKIANPVDNINAQVEIRNRRVNTLLISQDSTIDLTLDSNKLPNDFINILDQDLSTNSFWSVGRIFDYALCQILTNPKNSFSFNFTPTDRAIILNAMSKSQLKVLYEQAGGDTDHDSGK